MRMYCVCVCVFMFDMGIANIRIYFLVHLELWQEKMQTEVVNADVERHGNKYQIANLE